MTLRLGVYSALAGTLVLTLAACGGAETPSEEAGTTAEPTVAAPTEAAAAPATAAANAAPAAFAQCAVCHKVEEAKHSGIGPHLIGVVGAKAGSRGDYAYSPALKNSGITWDAEQLDAFITSPQRTVAGTKMAFGGIADATKRKEIVDYLATLK